MRMDHWTNRTNLPVVAVTFVRAVLVDALLRASPIVGGALVHVGAPSLEVLLVASSALAIVRSGRVLTSRCLMLTQMFMRFQALIDVVTARAVQQVASGTLAPIRAGRVDAILLRTTTVQPFGALVNVVACIPQFVQPGRKNKRCSF